MLIRLRRVLFVALIAVAALLPAGVKVQSQSQTYSWALDGPAFSVAPSALQLAAGAVHAEPLTDVTVLFEQEKYTITADGRATVVHQLLYRIEDNAGLENWNQASEGWNPWYQDQPVIKARVIQADGRVSQLDPKTLTDIPAKNEAEDTFSDARIYKGPLPGVAIGSIVEQETTLVDKLPFFSGGGVYRGYFSRGVPVVRSRLIVELPSDAPFQTKEHSLPVSAVVRKEQADGVRRTTWDLSPVPMSLNSDIDLATEKPRYPFVEFATGASWAAVASAYQKLAEPQIEPEKTKALLSTARQEDSLASVQALVSRLHKEVRYTGIEFGESALKPQNPAEILKRHYGDCKDKAALLVAMLRASGIPANLALLSTGPGYDVNPDLPGMNQFDHAIVHLPASASGRPELWIDATAEFTHVGDLPYMDEGRMALIIADGTIQLTKTPYAKPEDSVLIETREFTLKQFGPSSVVERSETTGHIDDDYRYRYGGAETKTSREDLEKYVKRAYAAKALTRVEHSDGSDVAKPFELRLEVAKAGRGTSTLTDAAVAIPPAVALSDLPSWFFNDPDAGDAKPTAEQEADRKKAEQQRAEEYVVRPHIQEIRYRIVVPEGFVARALPEDRTLKMGPAKLMEHFGQEAAIGDKAATVKAVFRFDTVKQHYSTEEALALRKAVLELDKQDYIEVQFDQAGAKLLAQGKVREALAADRALIAAHPATHPDAAMHHVQLAAALEEVGLGEEAQSEARIATELDPKLEVACFELAYTLEHNSIGVDLGKGFDRKAALAAYTKAKSLDPEDTVARTNLAILEEHNDAGDRYAEGSDLAAAIKEYRELKDVDKDAALRYEDSLLYALLYNRQFVDLLAELKTLPSDPTRDAMAIAATAASQDAAAGIRRADLVAGDSTQKSAALRLAGLQLIRLGMYPLAAEMLSAGVQGQADSAQVARQIEIFKNLKHADLKPLPASDPTAPVHLMLTSMMTGTMQQEVPHFLDRNAFANDAEWKKNLEHNDSSGLLRTMTKQSQLPAAVMRDVVIGNAKVTSTGDDAKGYRLTMLALGAAPQNLFVSHDAGQYRIVADGSDSAEVGNYALYLLDHNREAEARNLLDWKRSLVHRGGGDDPLEGNLFARFWSVGSAPGANAGADAIRIAAIALTIQKPHSPVSLEPALAAYKASPNNADLTLLLASAYRNHEDAAGAAPYIAKLLELYPDSITAIRLAGSQYAASHDYKAWDAMLKSRLTARPDDHDLQLQAAFEAEAEADWARARSTLQQVMDEGKATANDYNSYAWLALFDGKIDTKAIEAAQQANSLTKNASYNELHTLACLYAAQGKTTEARQLLLSAMTAKSESEPDSAVWFGFGLIYEQFGATDAAIAAYNKVERPDTKTVGATDTWVLAQHHLIALGVQ